MVASKVTSFKRGGKTVTVTLQDLGKEGYVTRAERARLTADLRKDIEAAKKGEGKAQERMASLADAIEGRRNTKQVSFDASKPLTKKTVKTLVADLRDDNKFKGKRISALKGTLPSSSKDETIRFKRIGDFFETLDNRAVGLTNGYQLTARTRKTDQVVNVGTGFPAHSQLPVRQILRAGYNVSLESKDGKKENFKVPKI